MKVFLVSILFIVACFANAKQETEDAPSLRTRRAQADQCFDSLGNIILCGVASGAGGCFSGTNTVQVKGRGLVSMDSLTIGDSVLSGDGSYTQIYSFLHVHRTAELEYLAMSLAGESAPLEVSPMHYLFQNGRVVAAHTVQVGDFLDAVGEGISKKQVVSIETVKRRGLYAPATKSGDLIVNGVRASNYVQLADASMLNPHEIAHAYMAPRRWWCSFLSCEDESYTEDGYSAYLMPLLVVISTFVNVFSAPSFQMAGSLLLGLGLAPLRALDCIFHHPFESIVLSLVLYFAIKKSSSKVKSM